jgi:hypothetical protein
MTVLGSKGMEEAEVVTKTCQSFCLVDVRDVSRFHWSGGTELDPRPACMRPREQ